MTHTKGPWTAEKQFGGECFGVYSDDATGSIVAQCGGFVFAPRPLVEHEANARLIAAAPDLYEALKSLPLDVFDKDPADIDAAEFVDHSNEFFGAMQKARAAIAKAEGR